MLAALPAQKKNGGAIGVMRRGVTGGGDAPSPHYMRERATLSWVREVQLVVGDSTS